MFVVGLAQTNRPASISPRQDGDVARDGRDLLAQCPGILSLAGHNASGREGAGLGDAVHLFDRNATSLNEAPDGVGQDVNLGRYAASGSPGFLAATSLGAPVGCRWTRTMAEVDEDFQVSAPSSQDHEDPIPHAHAQPVHKLFMSIIPRAKLRWQVTPRTASAGPPRCRPDQQMVTRSTARTVVNLAGQYSLDPHPPGSALRLFGSAQITKPRAHHVSQADANARSKS